MGYSSRNKKSFQIQEFHTCAFLSHFPANQSSYLFPNFSPTTQLKLKFSSAELVNSKRIQFSEIGPKILKRLSILLFHLFLQSLDYAFKFCGWHTWTHPNKIFSLLSFDITGFQAYKRILAEAGDSMKNKNEFLCIPI